METNISEFTTHPLPHVPQPQEPQRSHVQTPTVYVYEKQGWEYRVVSRKADEPAISEDELNAFGADGWELVGVVPLAGNVHFYLKRLCS